jgi:hypothetical protein
MRRLLSLALVVGLSTYDSVGAFLALSPSSSARLGSPLARSVAVSGATARRSSALRVLSSPLSEEDAGDVATRNGSPLPPIVSSAELTLDVDADLVDDEPLDALRPAASAGDELAFDALMPGLIPGLAASLRARGFARATPIQEASLGRARDGGNVLLQARRPRRHRRRRRVDWFGVVCL